MKDSDLLILVLTNGKNPWQRIFHYGAEPTWIHDSNQNANVITYKGIAPSISEQFRESMTGRMRHNKWVGVQRTFDRLFTGIFTLGVDKELISENVIDQPYPELHSTIGLRTLAAFKTALTELDWKYLWRANTSNYVNTNALIKFLSTCPTRSFAGGVVNLYKGDPYLSGAGYCLSRDVVERIVAQPLLWDHSLLDDVALGVILRNFQISYTEIPRITFTEHEQVSKASLTGLIQTPSFRCNGLHDREEDIKIMHSLHDRLCGRNHLLVDN